MPAGYQAVEAGIATHLVSSQKLGKLEEQLIEAGDKAANASVLERILSSFQAGFWHDLQAILPSFPLPQRNTSTRLSLPLRQAKAQDFSCARVACFLEAVIVVLPFAGRILGAHQAHWPAGNLARH